MKMIIKNKWMQICSTILCFGNVFILMSCSNDINEPDKMNADDVERFSTYDYAGESFVNSGSSNATKDAMKSIGNNANLNEANKELGFKMLEMIYSDKKNFSVSPLSLSIALAMVTEGASKETLDE